MNGLTVFFIGFLIAELLILAGLWVLFRKMVQWEAALVKARSELPDRLETATLALREGKVSLRQLEKGMDWLYKKLPVWFKVFLTTMRVTKHTVAKTVEARTNIL